MAKIKPKFFECGGCGEFHPLGFSGDCRDNASRYTLDRLPEDHEIVDEFYVDVELLESLKAKAEVLANRLGMHDVIFNIDTEMDNVDGVRTGALVIDGWLLIYPESIKSETLCGNVVNPGFALDVEITIHNYPNEPDDCDVDRVATSTSMLSILGKAFGLLQQQKLSYVLEGMGMEEQAEEEKDLPF